MKLQHLLKEADDKKYDNIKNLFPEYVEGTHCIHKKQWDRRDPVSQGWLVTKNGRIAHSKYVKGNKLNIYYRPTVTKCCRDNYNGHNDLLLRVNCTAYQKHGDEARCDLVSYSLLLDNLIDFCETGQTIDGFWRKYKRTCMYKYGMSEDDILRRLDWNTAVNIFWNQMVELDMKELFMCRSCGPRPHTLVFDGIAMGFPTRKLENWKNKMTFDIPVESPYTLDGSKFQSRMVIKFHKNRQILKNAAKNKEWPIYNPDYTHKRKRKEVKKDPGMDTFMKMVDQLENSTPPNKGFLKLMKSLSTKTSTTSLFQVIDVKLMEDLISYLDGSEENNFVKGISNIDLQLQLLTKYPEITEIILDLAKEDGFVDEPIANFLIYIIDHTLEVYDNSEKRKPSDYEQCLKEVDSQFFPNFPIKYKIPKYKKSCTRQDSRSFHNLCKKGFPNNKHITPGLFIMTCACPNKSIYGLAMMTGAESPGMICDIITSRFDEDYNPTIVYDASCKAKEFILNRETRRGMNITIVTDPFHQDNHTTCSKSFMSSIYRDMSRLNREAAEQTNNVL